MKFETLRNDVIETASVKNHAADSIGSISPAPCDGVAALEPTVVFCLRGGKWVFDRFDC